MSNNVNLSRSSQEDRDYVRKCLAQYNYELVPADLKDNYEEINLSIKNEQGEVVAGLNSVFCWNWIEVDILWVDPSCRGLDYGSKLLMGIEEIAKQKNCSFIKLYTYSFQAPGFYLKQGYEVIATIDNAPRGFQQVYYKKDL